MTLHELQVYQIELELQNEELRQSRTELEAVRERYFDLYDLAPVGYVTVSGQGLILEANLTMSTLLGVARGALVRQPFSRFIPKEDGGVYYLFHKRLIATGVPQSCELRLVKKDGDFFWAHLVATSAKDHDGADVCRITLSDITERKAVEDLFRFLGQRGTIGSGADFFQEMARYVAVSLKMDFVCIDVLEPGNLSARTLAMYDAGSFLDKISYALKDTPCGNVVGKQVCSFPREVCRAFPNDAFLHELRAECYLGATLWSSQNEPIGLIAVIGRQPLDDTRQAESILQLVAMRASVEIERMNADATVRRLNAELEQRVEARTAELAATNRELEAFCYSVSHDLRAPLRSMDGFSKALLEDYGTLLDAAGQDFLRRICSNSQRMTRLLDDLLNLSKIKQVHMRRKVVDLTELAAKAVVELRGSEPSRTVDVRIATGLTARGDPELLGTALTNLLENAWKFTSQRPDAVIEFGAERLPVPAASDIQPDAMRQECEGVPAPQQVFYVRDNGVGFDMRYADKLFTPFQRLHAMKEFPGAGIGLATVQRVIQRHGGRVWFESALGKGATFYFTVDANAPS